MPDDSPFGAETRRRVLEDYFERHPGVTGKDAWEHVYRLLLSIDRRSRLAHVYDSNHMQEGKTFHGRAVAFTKALCEHWRIEKAQLPEHLDQMFRACVREYLRQKEAGEAQVAATQLALAQMSDEIGATEGAERESSQFALEVTAILSRRFPGQKPKILAATAVEIEKEAEHYFTIGNKRQNVRGEGFEDVLEWLLRKVSGLPQKQILKRTAANQLPGFKPPLDSRSKLKVPKPDLVLLSPATDLTLWLVTAKWSLRQDRLDQFGQEYEYYKANMIQRQEADFVLVTNEMDMARLKAVLEPPLGAGGFHFHRVYHVNRGLLEITHGKQAFGENMRPYVDTDRPRLLSLEDLLAHTRAQLVLGRPPPAHAARRRRRDPT